MSVALLVFALTPNFYPGLPKRGTGTRGEPSTTQGHGLPWLHSNGKVILDSQGSAGPAPRNECDRSGAGEGHAPGSGAHQRGLRRDGRLTDLMSSGCPSTGLLWSPNRAPVRPYLDLIRSVVNDAAAHGIYTILDLHNIDWSIYYGGDGSPSWAIAGSLPRSFPLGSPWNRHWPLECWLVTASSGPTSAAGSRT